MFLGFDLDVVRQVEDGLPETGVELGGLLRFPLQQILFRVGPDLLDDGLERLARVVAGQVLEALGGLALDDRNDGQRLVGVAADFPEVDRQVLEVGRLDLVLREIGGDEDDARLRPVHVGPFQVPVERFVVFDDEGFAVLQQQVEVGDALVENARIALALVFDDDERLVLRIESQRIDAFVLDRELRPHHLQPRDRLQVQLEQLLDFGLLVFERLLPDDGQTVVCGDVEEDHGRMFFTKLTVISEDRFPEPDFFCARPSEGALPRTGAGRCPRRRIRRSGLSRTHFGARRPGGVRVRLRRRFRRPERLKGDSCRIF